LDKKNAGALKGSNEMRQITFSPYASRYYQGAVPDYKTFVENSPKIKAAVDMAIQVHKDNKDANQIFYAPFGVEFFPLIQRYLVKEGGYKENEVAIIAGGVSKAKKSEIQNSFNAGKIKVIIGSDTIQEGVNLQERTTDMYILALPWNFTELKQLVGRAWRQGNQWKRVRIHNIFIENSVDVFQSQKYRPSRSGTKTPLNTKAITSIPATLTSRI